MRNSINTKEEQRKQKILIADDSEINRAILSDMLKDGFTVLEAEDGAQAIDLMNSDSEIDLLLLDIIMPKMDGFEVLSVMNKYHWIEDIPVIMISAENSPSYANKAYGLGVTDYINRPFDEMIVRRRVINTLMLYSKQKKLAQMVTDQIYENEKQNSLMVNVLSHIVEFRNGDSGQHVLHIRTLTKLLLNKLVQKTNQYKLSYSDISLISTASSLHDIGKITIPDAILNKQGRLTAEEFEIMKTHAMAGALMLDALPFYKNEQVIKISYEICRWHHERYNGKGYPDGLSGENIPIAAQVVALADVYDALTSQRVYKNAVPHAETIDMILAGECGAFNPLLLECLTEIKDMIQVELKNDHLLLSDQRELKNISKELFQQKKLYASDRTLNLLERERTKFQFLAMMSREIQFEYLEATHIVTISEWGVRQLGISKISMNPYEDEQLKQIIGIENLKKLDKFLRQTTPENSDIQHDFQMTINGEPYWFRFICRATWLMDDTPQYLGAVGKVIDINEDHNKFVNLERLAQLDSLTKVLTHACAIERIQMFFSNKPSSKFALVLLDLDNFKLINDNRGHMHGDKVLCFVAGCLNHYQSETCIAARVGGDEFLLFFEYKTFSQEFIEEIFKEICTDCDGTGISISMGISTTESANYEYETLFRQADQALYVSKFQGRGVYKLYNESMKNMFTSIFTK